jgi:hypothetical protein
MREIAMAFAYTVGVGIGIIFIMGLLGILAALLWRIIKWMS